MVYDIIVEDISLTGNYRNQFNRVINNQGYPELVRLLQDKLQHLKSSCVPEARSHQVREKWHFSRHLCSRCRSR